MSEQKYISALSLRWLTPFYDALVEKPLSAFRMRRDLLELAGDLNGKKILDVGSGTGTLGLMIKQANPLADVTGVDGDPAILEIARGKAFNQGVELRFDQGMSFALPYPDDSFDVVTTSLMLHHLDRQDKERTVAEMFRVLRPGGRMVGLDFVEARRLVPRMLRPIARHLERVADNLDGFLPGIFEQAGFRDFTQTRSYLFGGLGLFQASKQS